MAPPLPADSPVEGGVQGHPRSNLSTEGAPVARGFRLGGTLNPEREVAGLVLAAGAGRRFGGPKAIVELDDERLVDRAVRLLRDGGCDPVVVVSGAVPLIVERATVVHNPDWPTGMGSSLRCGLGSLPSTADAVVVALVDQPYIGPEAVRRLIAAYQAGATAAVATYGGRRRNPVLLSRRTWDEVAASAREDVGARAYLDAHPGEVVPVPADGTGDPRDIDVPDDLRRRPNTLSD